MRRKTSFIIISLIAFLSLMSCSREHGPEQPSTPALEKNDSVSVVQHSKSEDAGFVYVDFKIIDADGRKVFPGILDKNNVKVIEDHETISGITVDSVVDISHQKIISNISMLFLIDQSGNITQEQLSSIYGTINNVAEKLPNTKIYISFMGTSITKSEPFTDNAQLFVKPSENTEKFLYKAILAKMEELAGLDSKHYSDVAHNEELRDSTQKMLFVITDGKVTDDKGYFIGGADSFYCWKRELDELGDKLKNSKPHISIHCFHIGDSIPEDIELEMSALCASSSDRSDIKGAFHPKLDITELQETLFGTIDSIAADYRLVLKNPEGRIYDGSKHLLSITIRDGASPIAQGNLNYSFGSQHVPIVVRGENKDNNIRNVIFMGLLSGILFIVAMYMILQYLVPWIKYKIFCKKYIIKYRGGKSGGSVNEERCYHCKEPFQTGDEIVVKCEHKVHLECWHDNRNRCPEYGIHNCTKGIHYYNQDKLSDPRNAPYFEMWMIYGLIAGLMSWLFLRLFYSEHIFSSLIVGMVNLLCSDAIEAGTVIAASFIPKMQPLLLCGSLLGFFITFFFNWQIEFRKKNLKIWSLILLRSIIGSIMGFISFLIGSGGIILLGKDTNCIYTDWIPWAIFAVSIALIVSFKTDIKLKSALIGGLISVIISFIVLFIATFAKEILSMFSYMLYAAGFGIAIAVVHHVSEKYFLRVSGPIKERDIAIYKWMSMRGGFNKVTIGKSIDCIVEMNWDDATNIADKQVEIYLENDRPYCKALSDGTQLATGQMLSKNQTILLSHGTEFTIGNSKFTYIEKDK